MDRNPQKFDPHKIKQPHRTVLTAIIIITIKTQTSLITGKQVPG